MLLTIAALVLVLLITFGQSICGLYSTMIMFLLSVIAACISFGTYESLNGMLLSKYLGDFGPGVSLIAVFLVVLIITRVLTDVLIKKNLEFPGIIDRLGGVLFGFGSAMVLTGMLAVSIQLLPFREDILGFNRLVKVDAETGEPIPEGGGERPPGTVAYKSKSLFPGPDGFTVNLVSMLSAHSFSGQTSFTDVHPKFLEEVQMIRSGPGKDSRRTVPPDIVQVKAVWPLANDKLAGSAPSKPAPENHWLCLRTRISSPSEAMDSDNKHRFAPIQVRLVGWDAKRGEGSTRQYLPAGIAMNVVADTEMGDHTAVQPDRPLMLSRAAEGDLVDFVFNVPKEFKPWFIAYKRGARAEVSEALVAKGPPQPKLVEAISQESVPETPPATTETEERVPGRNVHSGLGRFDRKLPVGLEPEWINGTEMDLGGSRYRRGHCDVDWPLFEAVPSVAIDRFFVPPGMKLYQLSVTHEEKQSMYGRAIQFAVSTLAQYYVIDDAGQNYFRCGEIRIAQVGTQEKLEIQYWPQAEVPERCIRAPRVIQDDNLTGNYTLIYMFLIPEARTPVKFHTGNRIRMLQ